MDINLFEEAIGDIYPMRWKASDQVSSLVTPEQDLQIVNDLTDVMSETMKPTIDKIVSDFGIKLEDANMAASHAALLALHDYGVIGYHFHMSNDLKKALQYQVPAIRYARRRIKNAFLSDLRTKKLWQLYKNEFGSEFTDHRRNIVTGELRKRFSARIELSSAASAAELHIETGE